MSEWISVKDKPPKIDLPDNGDNDHLHEYHRSREVLAWWRNSSIVKGYFVNVLREKWSSNHEQWFECNQGGSLNAYEISHWMPLPEPPPDPSKEKVEI